MPLALRAQSSSKSTFAPRFIDMAGRSPSSTQIIEVLKTQQGISSTRTRKLNLEPMTRPDTGIAAADSTPRDNTPRETLQVESESARLSFDQITFEFDSARISREALPVLQEIGIALRAKELVQLRFLIEGHTDATGSLQYNMQLSSRRAESVKRYLMARHGLPSRRLLTAGKGPTDLHEPDQPESSANRRVVLMAFEGKVVPT
ncbi:OmpA family protein [Variovorax sp. PCZ-1]|nr:OmpA family protein [Variovorax sp. PCZ-1]